jgi:DNA-binding PadR family transcriptional regulator
VKGDRLGEFEELSLLTVCALGDAAYGVAVQQHLEELAARPVTMGAVYSALERLERKGLLRSALGEPTRERGGKRKRLYQVTKSGHDVLRDVRRVRETLWRAIEQPKRGRA